MRTHLLNCFDIANAQDLCADYRLVDVDGPFDATLADGDLAEQNRQQLLQRIAYEERIPVALYAGGRRPILAVPAAHTLRKLEYGLSPDVATLHPRDAEQTLCLGKLDDDTRRIALSFLGWHIRSPLRSHEDLWSAAPWTFVRRRPLNYKDDTRDVDVFGGFGLRLGLRNGSPCLWVKLTHRYVESAWLLDVYSEHDIREQLKMRFMLYHYGHQWFRAQLLGLSEKSISDQRFLPDGAAESISVYDYTKQQVGRHRTPWIESLAADSPGIHFRYPGNEKKRHGAAALCKVMLATDDPRVSRLHHFSIKEPDRRFAELRSIVESYLQRASFQGQLVQISASPVRIRRRVFAVPPQEFGQGCTLHVGQDAAAGEIRLQDLGRKRMEMLLDPQAGVAVTTPLDAQYLIVPESQPRPIVEDFQKRLEQATRSFLHRGYTLTTIPYPDQRARTLRQQLDAILRAVDGAGVVSGRGVLMLPARAEPDLHNFIKKKLRQRMQFQCVDATKVADFYLLQPQHGRAVYAVRHDRADRYRSYLRYVSMGLLLVNRQWPWVLAKNTHYDAYIGLDVLHGTAAFTFFFEGGRQCFLHAVDSQQKERLLRKQVRSVMYEQLALHLKAARNAPHSIILRRDGRSFASERQGLQDAIERLVSERMLPSDVLHGVIEVQKTSAEGFRLVEDAEKGGLRNPQVGAWEAIGAHEGIVCTTGFPFRFRGTVNPLAVSIVDGDLNLEYVLQDTFDMSQLCWPVPDRCTRLSVDLKLCDDYLRSIAADADADEGQFGSDGEWEEDEEPAPAHSSV